MTTDANTVPQGAPSSERLLWPAVAKGLRGSCPQCGEGRLYHAYLKVADKCDHCGQALRDRHRADDFPPYLTIIVVGHLIVPLVWMTELRFDAPSWVGYGVWPGLAVVLCLTLLPRIKGGVIAMQWAHRMHGFGDDDDEGRRDGPAAGGAAEAQP